MLKIIAIILFSTYILSIADYRPEKVEHVKKPDTLYYTVPIYQYIDSLYVRNGIKIK